MLTSWESIRQQEQKAFDMLTCPFVSASGETPDGKQFFLGSDIAQMYPAYSYLIDDPMAVYAANVFITKPELVTGPATIKQELLLSTATSYSFLFAAGKSPDPGLLKNSATVWGNNMVLDKNDVAAVYGIRFRLGYSDPTGAIRIYQTFPNIPGDGFIYNGTASLKVESETQMTLLNMDDFKEVPEGSVSSIQKYDGMMLLGPIRIIGGQLGKLTVSFAPFNQDAISSLILSENTVVECTLMCVYGQASAASK